MITMPELKTEWQRTVHELWNQQEKKGQIGIEIEIPGAVTKNGCPGWVAKNEGSLRRGGTEFVYEVPGLVKNIPAKLATLNEHLVNSQSRPNLNDHVGSVHIHVNVQKQTIRQVIGSVIVFTIVEPFLLNMCGPKRNGNYFCMSNHDTGDVYYQVKQLLDMIKNRQLIHWREGLLARGRYAAQNIDSVPIFGSMEYRSFPCSLDGKLIQEWATICCNIQEAAEGPHHLAFMDVCNRARNQPEPFLQAIFGYRDFPEIATWMPIGLRTAYMISNHLSGVLVNEGALDA